MRGVVTVTDPPVNLQGRAGALRVKASFADMAFFAIYLPPATAPGLLGIAQELFRWLRQALQSLPRRCQPVIGVDLNSPLGVHSSGEPVDPAEQVSYTNGRQTRVGDLFANLLLATGMVAISTRISQAPTFYGQRGYGSHIDFICVGRERQQSAGLAGGADFRLARQLQLIPDSCLRHHVPIWVWLPVGHLRCDNVQRAGRFSGWDFDKLARAVQTSVGNGDFLEAVAQAAESHDGELRRLSTTADVDAHWEAVQSIVVQAAREHFARKAPAAPADEVAWRAERDALLRRRAVVRRCFRAGADGKWSRWELRLYRVSKLLQRSVRRRWRQRMLRLEAEMAEAWRRRNLARCYALSREISGRGGHRAWRHLAGCMPSRADWEEAVRLPGAEGSMLAQVIDFEFEKDRFAAEQDACEGGPSHSD